MKKATKNRKQGRPGKSKRNRSLVKRNRQGQHKGKHQETSAARYYIGTLDVNSRGNDYMVVKGLGQGVFVASNFLNKALHGDRAEVYVFPCSYNRNKVEGKVTKIIERKKQHFIGTVQLHKSFTFVVPTGPHMYTDFFVKKNKLGGMQDGDRVIIRIDDWKDHHDSPIGMVEQVLDMPGHQTTEMHSILTEYGLPYTYPEEAEAFVRSLDLSIKKEEISHRRDMHDTLTFTIDPRDAKDFDDALSLKMLDSGDYEMGVHITDVSRYMKEDTILDEEAYSRTASVYLADRVVPMLLEVLCSFACSLRPDGDKYTFSAVFEMDQGTEILNVWLGRTATHSLSRFAYEEAQSVIEEAKVGEGYITPADISITDTERSIPANVVETILTLNTLAQRLRSKHIRLGTITFDKVEVKFSLDDNGNPTGVYFRESKGTDKLIGGFMLLANRKVTKYVAKMKKTFVYRIHDEPDTDKLQQFNEVITRFGYSLNLNNKKTITDSLNNLLEEAKGRKEQSLVDTLAVRSMAKASYSTKNIGHYDLAFDYYTHLASPIHRYPDVVIHRLLQLYLDNDPSQGEAEYETKCKHSSQMESLAASAERDSIKCMQVKYMEGHKNQILVGVISGVTEWGVYVKLDVNKCEDLVHARDIKDDCYTFDKQQYALVEQATDRTYQLGDKVMIRVKNTDLLKERSDFELVRSSQLLTTEDQ